MSITMQFTMNQENHLSKPDLKQIIMQHIIISIMQ